jgi:hypothetical protein
LLINSTQNKNNATVMSKNKTTIVTNNLNVSNNVNNNNTTATQKGQIGQSGSTVAKAGLDSIMGQKLTGPKISTVKR